MRKIIKLLLSGIIALVAIIAFVFYANYTIEKETQTKTFSDTNSIPYNTVGLVLGTAKILKNGRINLYFKYRIDAAVKLYKAGKVEFLLISGDNSSKSYDEPEDFKTELVKQGIPEDKIYLDYAGFRTLDSVVRAKEIFGQTNITIISQKFHNERAIYLAKHFGINAVGFNARDVIGFYGLKVKIREYLARTKAVLDIVFGIEPKFLGNPITIE